MMKFIAGFVTAIVLIIIAAAVVTVTGTYNVAATSSESGLERMALGNVMSFSVRTHASPDIGKTWTHNQMHDGFQEYNEMCVYCHGAPGKEASDIGKGLRPPPPDLAEAAQRWNNSELFWIIKNGIKMTGMPAFSPTHSDDTIWNIVGFVRELSHMTADQYSQMEEHVTQPHEQTESHEHHH
jgi:mono/diheme cytochrome c family protein